MKFTITFKDPDGVYDSIKDTAREYVLNEPRLEFLDQPEKELLISSQEVKITEFLQKFIKWEEYISIEFDIEQGIAKVLEIKE